MLEERAMLVKVTVHTWTGVITDQEASEEVAQTKGASPDLVRVKKSLLGKALKAIQGIVSELREYVRLNTLPWYDGNWRILPASKYLEFAQRVGEYRRRFERAVRDFSLDYPGLVQRARTLLGNLYRDRDFPPPQDIPGLFRIEVDFSPIPRGNDFRLAILDEAQEELRRRVEERYREAFGRIREHLRRRAIEMCDRIEKCLGGKKAVVTQALIRDLKEMPGLLDGLNVIDDPDIRVAAEKIRRLADYDVETVRRSPLVQGLFLSTARGLRSLLSSRADPDVQNRHREEDKDEGEGFSREAC